MQQSMGRKPALARVLGPYQLGPEKWVIEVRTGPRSQAGSREVYSYRAEDQALTAKAEYERLLPTAARASTFRQAIEAYREALIAKGNKEKSWKETIRRMLVFFSPVLDRDLASLKPIHAAGLYRDQVERLSVDSHRNYLLEARSFLKWCVKSKLIPSNPLDGVEGQGRRTKGKKKLYHGEAHTLYLLCLHKASKGDEGAVACLMMLVMGLRATEITLRTVRDVDGKYLHIPEGKTDAAERTLEVPKKVAAALHRQAGDRKPNEPLFPAESESGFHTKDWPNDQAHRLCKAAGVPEVTAHGLRGTQASLGREMGVSALLVAQTLGHEDTRMQDQAYVSLAAQEKGRTRRAMTVLEGGKR